MRFPQAFVIGLEPSGRSVYGTAVQLTAEGWLDTSVPVPTTETVELYRRLRGVRRELNTDLFRMVPKPAMHECGRRLGILRRKTHRGSR
jgi:hypothetical protein